jgi:hypothetical protein
MFDVSESVEEAAAASDVHHSHNRWELSQNKNAAHYNAHTHRDYARYQQLRNRFVRLAGSTP